MAVKDFATFRPSESAYLNPGEAEASYRAQAAEKASYLSETERLYRTLEEQGRQFDLGLGESKRQFTESLGENKRQFTESLGENKRQFTESLIQQREQFGESLGFQREQLGFQREQLSSTEKMFEESLGFQKEQFQDTLEQRKYEFLQTLKTKWQELRLSEQGLGISAGAQEHSELMDWINIGMDAIGYGTILFGGDNEEEEMGDNWYDFL